MQLAMVNTKGGVGKTTAAIYVATGLSQYGRVLLADCDPQQSALTWSQGADLPFTVVGLPVRDVHKRISDLANGYTHIVLDTPPGDTGIIRSAVMAVQTVIVPVAPSGLDLNRMRPTFELLAELEPIHPVDVGVLLTKIRRGTLSSKGAREVLTELGYPILDTEIPLAEHYAAAFGTTPVDLGYFNDLVKELTS